MDLEEANPYDDSTLREAWRRGWRAQLDGEPEHIDILWTDESGRAKAWRAGYDAAETGGPDGFG